ncbi:hypothetical protein LF1_58920 [Rubripirellula obstinata]|uniref:Uncharacterized protein n=1 Tax=Rubripirellula obstinata TaxID=406547 RepID=A0A5B1C6W3_9BACT|nr:hypothetical protein LF1_58920 [Rubripirellula obstinata]
MIVTYVDEVRADGSHRNGGFRITIACTGVAAARSPLCLHVKSRHLGDAYRYPTEARTLAARLAPCGASLMLGQERLPPTLDQHRNADCPAGHQPTPELQYSNNAEVPDALRGTNQRLSSSLPLLLTTKTCFAGDSLLRFQHGGCHPAWTKSALTDRIAMVHCG